MTDQDFATSGTNLSFVALGRAGLAALFGHFFSFLKVAAIPLALVFMLGFANHVLASDLLRPFTQVLVEPFSGTLFGMAWLGFLLLPADSRRHWLPRWSPQHFVFLGYALLIGALQFVVNEAVPIAVALLDSAISIPTVVLLAVVRLPVDYIHCGLGLALCALAVAQPGGPLWSWRLLGWNALKMVVIVNLGTVSFIYVGNLGSNFVIASPVAFGFLGFLAAVPRGIAEFAAQALTLGVFAFAYRQLTGWPKAADQNLAKIFE